MSRHTFPLNSYIFMYKVKCRFKTIFYLFQKRREQKVKEQEHEMSTTNNGRTRFMGGGFSLLAIPPKSVGSQS